MNRLLGLGEHVRAHVLLGNHDMHIRHRGGHDVTFPTSLDALLLEPLSPQLSFHRDVGVLSVDGHDVAMLPYYTRDADTLAAIQASLLRGSGPLRLRAF